MDAKLVVVGGEARVTEIELDLPLTVGRGRSSGMPLPHPLVSRKHCEIYEEEGKIVVNDLGSLNGTFVGDRRINEPTFLMPGELLTIGTVTFRAVYQVPGADDFEQPAEESTTAELPRDEPTIAVDESTKKPARAAETAEFNEADDDVADDVELVEVDEIPAEADEVVGDEAFGPVAGVNDEESDSLGEVEKVDDLDELEEVEAVEEVDDLEELEDVEAVDDVELAEVDEVESVDEVDPIDFDATVPAPQPKPKPAAAKAKRESDQPKPSQEPAIASTSKSPGAVVAEDGDDVEMVEEEEEVSAKEIAAADHDTKEVESPADLDTEAVESEEDDDDLQSFLRGLG